MKNLVQLRNLLRHQRQWRCLQSFGTWPDAQVLRTLEEELRISEEQEQHEELVLKILKILAVRAQLRNLAVRALLVKHLAYVQVSLA